MSRRNLAATTATAEEINVREAPTDPETDAPADVLMEGVVEKLKLLGYEESYCRSARPPKRPLHRLSHVVPFANPREQTQGYFDLVDLVLWLLATASLGRHSKLPTPDAAPGEILQCIHDALKGAGINPARLTQPKFSLAYGDTVAWLLDVLTDQALVRTGFAFSPREAATEEGPGDVEEMQDPEEDEDADALADMEEEESGAGGAALPEVGRGGGGAGMTMAPGSRGSVTPPPEARAAIAGGGIDALRWREEVERLTPKLKLVADSRDWRSHLEMAHKHAHEVSEVLPSSRALFESLHQQLVGELDALSAREAALNDQFESARMRYKDAREEHDGGRSRLHGEAENLTRTKNDLSRCEEQLEEIRTQLEEHGKGGSSSSGVMMKTKQAIRQLEEEMRQMDVRMGVLESTVLKKMLQRHEAPVAV